jgi:hypothetical protein
MVIARMTHSSNVLPFWAAALALRGFQTHFGTGAAPTPAYVRGLVKACEKR